MSTYRRHTHLQRISIDNVGQCLQIQSTWTYNVRTLSELLRAMRRNEWQETGGAGRIERFEGRRWRDRGRMLAMGFSSLQARLLRRSAAGK